eukprot:PhF_6_TR27863/c0_g1_i4/m.40743/K08730/PTDSS2; phosphatidylserine synthase 2
MTSVVKPQVEEYDFVDAAFKPHTVTAGCMVFTFVIGLYFVTGDYGNSHYSSAIAAAVGVFLMFATVYFPDSGLLVRPHPAIWRFFLGVAVLYLMFMVYLFFISLEDARKTLSIFDPKVLTPLPERSYAEDCRISTPDEPYKFWTTVFDEFILAHLAGFFVKTIVIRDPWIVMAVSIGFELAEYSFQHWLPNFKECWWDHLFIDILICNAGGMVLGLIALHYFNAKKYDWVKLKNIQSMKGKARRIAMQLTPRNWHMHEWGFFNSPTHTLEVLVVLTVFMVEELNVFTSKYVLWLRPTHPFVIGRVAMWGFFALPGVREYYVYFRDPIKPGQPRRMGSFVWVCGLGLMFESLVIIKYSIQGGFYKTPFPPHIAVPWIISISSWALWFVLRYASSYPPSQLSVFRKAL